MIRLGTGATVDTGIGSKAANLDRAAAGGLPVPTGWVVPDGAPTPEALPEPTGRLAVRSAFSAEDTGTASLAGHFATRLGVDPGDLAAAVDEVRGSADGVAGVDGDRIRRDVLVMVQVEAERSGVAFTQQQFEDDLVNVTDGLGDRLVGGEVEGERRRLPKLRRWERPDPDRPPWEQRLSYLLADLRRVLGAGDPASDPLLVGWDVEWADDGTTCWLLQARPITAAPLRNEAFTIANHKEILPELPSTLMVSVIERRSSELLGFWSDIDERLPVHRPFVETFLGRPYLNLSMLTDLMRSLGLPSRLVTDSYGGTPDVDTGLQPGRLVAALPALARMAAAQVRTVASADAAATQIEAAQPAADTFAATLDTFGDQYVALVSEMSALASALAPPTAVLTRLGVLDLHLRTHRTAATVMLDRLGPLRAATADGLGPGDPAFDRAWRTWADSHGHRGVYESDIARPRFADDPTPILAAAAAAPPAGPRSTPGLAVRLRRLATTPIWWLLRRPMTAREDLRDRAMRGFAATRRRLVALADAAVADGRLPDADAVWLLSADELAEIDEGRIVTADEAERRRTERSRLIERRLPDTVHRFDDLDAPVADDTDADAAPTRFRGLPLVGGRVAGTAWRMAEPPTDLPAGFDPADTVLVARSVDAGWVPVFGRVAAVAVEIGGDLSHGSIILRELGVPSITNLGELGASIRTGDRVEVDGRAGTLAIVGRGPEHDEGTPDA